MSSQSGELMKYLLIAGYLFVQYHNPLFTYNLVNNIIDLVQKSI